MVSTVRAKVDPSFSSIDVIRNSFPMGSMTGAPKYRAMQVIDEVEMSRRGIFSGTIGYFSPDGDFDFNVVIRSVLYQEKERYLSFTSGGAITFDSDPEAEFEETLLKGARIGELLFSISLITESEPPFDGCLPTLFGFVGINRPCHPKTTCNQSIIGNTYRNKIVTHCVGSLLG